MFRTLFLAGVGLLTPCFSAAFDPATQDDSQALVRHFLKPTNPVGPPLQQGAFFHPRKGETITLMGGADVFRMQKAGFWEAMLQTAFYDRNLKFRNIGWPSDTVYRQQRPMFFYTKKGDTREGSVPDQREKMNPGVFVLFFGKMESLDGEARIADFEAAYRGLLSELMKLSQRIVVVAPIQFSDSGPAGELAEVRNQVLSHYAEVCRKVAEDSGALYLDLEPLEGDHFERNGLYLSELGQQELAKRMAKDLGVGQEWSGDLLAAVRAKNRLWDQYYRPTNWAFLYGDRQHVPSSRDHLDTSKRWFEEELKKIPQLIAEREKEIWKLAEGGAR